jgi:2-polyprenyl-3-methyl-5-hydroxy-6-metoxy-1,4-benzoquinol methylase
VFLANVPEELNRYYANEYYAIPTLERLHRISKKGRSRIDVISRFALGKRLLEIGPAFGVFAWQAKQAGFDVEAIEMDDRCVRFLTESVGIRARRSDVPHEAMAGMAPQDVIAIWHVIEHLREPLALLKSAAANLSPGGILAIGAPNPEAFQFRVMGAHWPHLDAPRHVTLIPAQLLARIAADLGLAQIYLAADDAETRYWNRFGWQRLLMNRLPGRMGAALGFATGALLSLPMAWWDRSGFNGSAYTAIFRKEAAA